jgi:branched-chain amino acid transport system substrate-binding protein
MLSRRILFSGLAAAVLAAGGLVNLRMQRPTSAALEVGALLPLTGSLAQLGTMARDGLMLAQDDINAAGGVDGRRINVAFEDTKGEPATAVTGAQKLLNVNRSSVILTQFTGPSAAVKPVIADRGSLQVIFAMDEALTANKGGGHIFRIYPGIREEGRQILRAVAAAGSKRVAVVNFKIGQIDAEVREVITPGLQSAGVASEVFVYDDLDTNKLRNIASKVKVFAPDAVVLLGFFNQLPLVIDILDEHQIRANASVIGGLNLAIAIENGGVKAPSSTGMIAAVPVAKAGAPDAVAKDFGSRFAARFGKSPDLDASYAYTTLRLLADAAKGTDGGSGAIADRLKTFADRPSPIGRISVGTDGNATTSWTVVRYKDGAPGAL